MLKQLLIRNFAVIEELDLLLRPGMTVFTGETGAGKSILIGALGLVLGDRADAGIIRAGCERTEISATFNVKGLDDVADVLNEQEITVEDDEILVRRVIANDGRSRAFVNSTPVTVNLLRRLGSKLIDIHGQHAHQSLMKRDVQRSLLDNYGDYSQERDAVITICREWRVLEDQIRELSGSNEDYNARLTLLRYQVQELELLAPEENEYETLNEEFRRLDNANRLIELAQNAMRLAKEDEFSADNLLSGTLKDLQEASEYDDSFKAIIELVEGAVIQLSEASDELRRYLDRTDLDPERLNTVENRLSDFHEIARKHNIQARQIFNYLQELQEQLYSLENSEKLLEKLQLKKAECLQSYQQAAKKLHACRTKTAKVISKEITASLAGLGMPDGKFVISVEEQPNTEPNVHGNDVIEFLVSANPGQPPQPLRKVASGGELSRISLAIQVASNNDKIIPTLVFDEVDAGIGGGIAEIVGKLLHSLADKHQVFCVTHLAQVASIADQHLQVQKYSNRKTTQTAVAELDDEQRIEEIARMLGGLKITEQSRKHAKEMLIN